MDVESWLWMRRGKSTDGLSSSMWALNWEIKEPIAEMKRNTDVLGPVLAMIEVEGTTKATKVGHSGMTTTIESTAGRIRGHND